MSHLTDLPKATKLPAHLIQKGVIGLVILLFSSCFKTEPPTINDARGNFEALWKIIDTRYCYLDYKNIHWDSIYTAYSPRIDTVKSIYNYFDILGEMLNELKDGHVNLYSSFDRSRYTKWYADYPQNMDKNIVFSKRYIGDNYRTAGGLYYGKIANNEIGYIYYSSFSNSFSSTNLYYILKQFSTCKGIILDVRSNTGGRVDYAENLASVFFAEKRLTGYIRHKTGDGHNDFSSPTAIYTTPNPNVRWLKPIVILTNRLSYSATNDFVGRMKYAPRATIVGDDTGGGGGLPLSSELPNGWLVRFSASPSYNAEMENIEWGIRPDIKVNMSAQNIVLGIDDIIEMGIKTILGEKNEE